MQIKLGGELGPKFLNNLGLNDISVTQSAIYGLGLIAQYGGELFLPLKQPTFNVR